MTVTAQNYALVLGELNLDEQQIKAAETLLRENPLLTQVLSDPRVRFAEKEKCLDRIFTPPFSSFMKVLCKHERVYALTEILRPIRICAAKKRARFGRSCSAWSRPVRNRQRKCARL